MSTSTITKTQDSVALGDFVSREKTARDLAGLAPGIAPNATNPVNLSVPSLNITQHEDSWRFLLTEPSDAMKRRGLLESVRAILALNNASKSESISLSEVAAKKSESCRRTLENAWVTLLEKNRRKEEAVRSASLFFSNLQDSVKTYKKKIFAVYATAEEIASDAGLKFLEKALSNYYHRPDPRQSRAYLIVHGWVGSKTALDRLGRVADNHRALLVTDAPAFDSMENLHTAATEGGLLESIPGEEVYHRHMVVLANRGLVRNSFQGVYAAEKKHVYVPMSGPWFGHYLDNIVRGLAWKPPIGAQNPMAGIFGTELDLLLTEEQGHSYFAKHRLNPAVVMCAGSEKVLIWGPDSLSKSGGGVQIGVAVNELRVIRYAEWIVNTYGLLDDLDEAERVVREKLTGFIVSNSGAGRSLRAGSRVLVTADEKNRCLNIDFILNFREVTERAVIHLKKPTKITENGSVEVE